MNPTKDPVPAGAPAAAVSVFRNRNFVLLWQAQLVSTAGTELHTVALALFVADTLRSPRLLGLILMTASLPGLLLGPFAGVWVDGWSRKRTMVAADVMSGVAVLALATVFTVTRSREWLEPALFATALAIGMTSCFFAPALNALIPEIVEPRQLVSANSANSSTRDLATIVAHGLGGWFYTVVGPAVVFFSDGVSYLLSALGTGFIRPTAPPTEAGAAAGRSGAGYGTLLREGFYHVTRDPGLRLIFVAAAVMNFMIQPFFVLLPFFVSRQLHAPAAWYGYLLAGFSLGSVAGYVAAARFTRAVLRGGGVLGATWVVLSAGLTGLSLAHSPWVALAFNSVAGMAAGYFNVNTASVLQTSVPSHLRGRVFALLRTIAMGLTPMAMGLSGIVADAMGGNIPRLYLMCGLCLLVVSTVVSAQRPFRAYFNVACAASPRA